MKDRELLEAAAKAAGIQYEWHEGCGNALHLTDPAATAIFWNPLASDSDALRLAVKLRMCVESWGSGAAAVVTINNCALVAEAHYGDDPERATRRAIVRAAAAMGEKT